MTDIYPFDVRPTTSAAEMQGNNEKLESIIPWEYDNIGRHWSATVDTSDGGLDAYITNLVNNILSGQGGNPFTDLDVRRNLTTQWKNGTDLWVVPGHVLHRGKFKRQGLDGTTSQYRVINAAASIPANVCPPNAPGTSGLDRDTWYYSYADVGVAGAEPTIRICATPPTINPGFGPEHPTETDWRYLGAFHTEDTADAFIEAFNRYENGRFFWRARAVGPWEPKTNLSPDTTAGAVTVDATKLCPPSADSIFLTVQRISGFPQQVTRLRMDDDSGATDGYGVNGYAAHSDTGEESQAVGDSAWLELPINTIDPNTGLPRTDSKFWRTEPAAGPYNFVYVAGFHENI